MKIFVGYGYNPRDAWIEDLVFRPIELVADPREPRTLLAGARTGHLGPTIFHSDDGGWRWTAQCRITGRRRQCLRGSIARSNAAIPMAADGIPA
jgi:hypothetical protein